MELVLSTFGAIESGNILVVPITSDYLRSMKIIGQNIDIDIITQSKTMLFF